jgi:hypothetical protein
MTSNQVNMNRNPTGKGGFGERPEDINRSGTWNPRMTFSFQCRRFMNMTVEEFKSWKELTADKDKTMVEELAYVAVLKARTEFRERQEVANRTEGMPKQSTDLTTNGKDISPVLVKFIDKNIDESTND